MRTLHLLLASVCCLLIGCSSVQPRAPEISTASTLTTTTLADDSSAFAMSDGRETPLRTSVQLDHGIRIGDDMMQPGPVDAVSRELWRAVQRHPKREKVVPYLRQTPVALTDFEAAIVGRSLADATVRRDLPAVEMFDYLVRQALDRAAGASESSLMVKVRVGGYTHYAIRTDKHLGRIHPEFLATMVRGAADVIVTSLAKEV